jgi:hypothetical protein
MFHRYLPQKQYWKGSKTWKLVPIRNGIRISIAYPFRRKWLMYLFLPFLAIWTLIGIGMMLLTIIENDPTAYLWIAAWSAGEIAGISVVSKYFSKEIITIKTGTMNIRRSIIGILAGKDYHLSRISHLRTIQTAHLQERLCFNYERTSIIHFGTALTSDGAQTLAQHLSDMLTFSCHNTE